MKFELSETIFKGDSGSIMDCLENQFRKVSESLVRHPNQLNVSSIQATFGSINRDDDTVISIKQSPSGFLLVAEVHYRPSIAFWIFILIGLFTGFFWLLPIVFYLYQKNTVKEAIIEVFKRVKDETELQSPVSIKTPPPFQKMSDKLDDLQKYAELKEKGVLTDEEFLKKKKELLGI